MKKLIATLLTLALLSVLYGGAFADTLTLPSTTTVIEEEAFSDNPALDEVVIPWGAEAIESRAFAYSGVKIIHIPGTVTRIADDAFEGTSVTIRAEKNSYAMQYADAHNFLWEDASSYYMQLRRDVLADFDPANLQLEQAAIPLFDTFPTNGIDGPNALAQIAEYNRMVVEANAVITSCNDQIMTFGVSGKALKEALGDCSMVDNGAQITFTMGDTGIVVDKAVLEKLDKGSGFSDIVDEGEGTSVLTLEKGEKCYLYESGDTLYWTLLPPSGGATQANAYTNAPTKTPLERFEEAVDNVEVYFDIANASIDAIKKATERGITYQHNLRLQLLGIKEDYPDNLLAQEMADWLIEQADGRRADLGSLRRTMIWAQRILNAMDIVGSLFILNQISVQWHEINDIESHGHPTEQDMYEAGLDLSRQMNDNIRKLQRLFIADGIATVITIGITLSEVIAMLTTPPAGAVALPLVLISTEVNILLNLSQNNLYDKIWSDENELHNVAHIHGVIKDAKTGAPVEGVQVRTDSLLNNKLVVGTTDSKGEYNLYVHAGNVTLVFDKEGYKKDGIVVGPRGGEEVIQDRKLEPLTGVVYGYVYGRTGDGSDSIRLDNATITLEDVTIQTDADGYYEVELPVNGVKARFSKRGYKPLNFTLVPFENKRTQLDMFLEPEGDIPIDEEHFPDDSFREYVKQFDEDNNALLSIVELNSAKSIEFFAAEGKSFEGIEYFYMLETLRFDGTAVTSLDLQNMEYLKEINTNQILTSVHVNNCDALFSVAIRGNELAELDFRNCRTLAYLSIDTCASLDVNGCSSLKELDFQGNHNKQGALKNLDVRGCTSLESLTCSYQQLTNLDLTGCTSLKRLGCEGNQIKSLDVNPCKQIEVLWINANPYTSLELHSLPSLWQLNLSRCVDLKSLIITDCPALENVVANGLSLNYLFEENVATNYLLFFTIIEPTTGTAELHNASLSDASLSDYDGLWSWVPPQDDSSVSYQFTNGNKTLWYWDPSNPEVFY